MSGPQPLRLILTTVGDEESARRLARKWVEERAAACVSVVPGLRSWYRWRGELVEDGEWLLLVKTAWAGRAAGSALLARLAADHPYEEPEFLVFEADLAAPGYHAWVVRSLTGEEGP